MSFEDYFQDGVLNINDPLFNVLSNIPSWWEIIRNDKDLYVNIRKYNRINVYYRGASVMSLKHDGNVVKAEIHNHYLGVEKDIAVKLGVSYGNTDALTPAEIVCRLDLIKQRIRKNKKFISNLEDNGLPQNNSVKVESSEKYIQSKMYLSNNYIDTEFAVRLDNGTDIRIDLVSLDSNGLLQFEELKTITDSRLRSSDPKKSEILVQMGSYNDFIIDAKAIEPMIVNYYQKVIEIMDKIGVLPVKFKGTKIKGLSDYVNLFIDGTAYQKQDKGKTKRLVDIQGILRDNNIKSNIDDVIEEYKKLPQNAPSPSNAKNSGKNNTVTKKLRI